MATTYEDFRKQWRLEGAFQLGRVGLNQKAEEFSIGSKGAVTGDVLVSGKLQFSDFGQVNLNLETMVATLFDGAATITDFDGKDAEGDDVGMTSAGKLKKLWVRVTEGEAAVQFYSTTRANYSFQLEKAPDEVYYGFENGQDIRPDPVGFPSLYEEFAFSVTDVVSPITLEIHLILER